MNKQELSTLLELGIYVIPQFLDAELCYSLRNNVSTLTPSPANVIQRNKSVLNEKIRRTKTVPFTVQQEKEIAENLNSIIPVLNKNFEIDLTGFQVPQLLYYKKGDFFEPHQDKIENTPLEVSERKVSVVIFLNSQESAPSNDAYCGGSLTFYRLTENTTWQTCRTRVRGETGLLVAFKSDTFHEVTKVRDGERFTVVSWFH